MDTPLPVPGSLATVPAAALLTLWFDAQGQWHAGVVLPDGLRLEFLSPFELARWSRGAAVRRTASETGLR
jgi:hypothetical protein